MLKEELDFYTLRCKLFLSRIKPHRFGETVNFTAEYAVEPEMIPFKQRKKLKYKSIGVGETWSTPWHSGWFHLTARIPSEWLKKELACEILFTGEALIFDEKGVPEWALTSRSEYDNNYEKALYFFDRKRIDDGILELWIEASAYGLCGVSNGGGEALKHTPVEISIMRVGIFNREAWQLFYDFQVLFDLYSALPANDYRRVQLLSVLNRAVDVYAYDTANAAEARAILAPFLARPAMASAVEATAIGHAHIDVAWLWPMRESIRKAGRTFASQLKNIQMYPGYIFGASQPVLYSFVKEHYPELYKRIKEAVRAGRWELQGGMWVEADCNIINGESMIRQFLHGKNFFMDEFGVEVKSLWLPDVFGYAATLPQIIRKANCDYFLTQKISWNQFNKFPYHSFIWQGLDGSQVLTHFPPENTYNASCLPSSTIRAQNNCTEADSAPMMMSLFGIGDGGGGPSEQHLERARRIANLEGCPRYTFGKAGDFFKKLEALQGQLPLWKGELYLEMHRGTLTTQARTKRNNRTLEQALPALEFIASALPIEEYPAAELDYIWKNMLKLQFHDVIPGSSIRMVYEDTEKEHAELIEKVEQLAFSRLPQLGRKRANAMLCVNSLSYAYTDRIAVPEEWLGYSAISPDGTISPVQKTEQGAIAIVSLPASSFCTITRGKKGRVALSHSRRHTLENELIAYYFDDMGQLISAFDKESQRELLLQGKVGNRFTLQEDMPNVFDAWDVEITMDEERQWHLHDAKLSQVEAGPVLQCMKLDFSIGKSSVRQHIMLRSNSKRLDFLTEIEWNEEHKLLRVNFPVDIFAREASFDIQYGTLTRPINTNTSWEKAKFEVCGQRYADISEADYGVALLNNCKYGYRTNQGELELSLLKAPSYPDPLADRGYQCCTYSLLPHNGDLRHSNVLEEAAMLNRQPLTLFDYEATLLPPFNLVGNGATLEVVKKAEKGDNLVIRIVETAGARTSCVLKTTLPKAVLYETNLLEWTKGKPLNFKQGKLPLNLRPYEIKTLLVTR